MTTKLKDNFVINSALIIIFLLNLIWLIPNTIALRNIFIYLSTLLIITAFFTKKIILNDRTPILFIAAIIAWLAFHVVFIGVEKEKQFSEYTSTWLRSILAFFIGMALTLFLNEKKYSVFRKFFFLSGTSFFLINFIIYSIESKQIYLSGMYDPLFKSKIGLMLACFPGMAYLIHLTFKNFNGSKKYFFVISILFMYFIIFKIGSTRNGMLITVIMATILFIGLTAKKKKYIELFILFLSFIIILMLCQDFFKYLSHDFISAYDNYNLARLWMENSFANSTNIYNNLSNYIRVSHFIAGLELLFNYPLGYGLMEGSFPKLGVLHWGTQFKYQLSGTHSGLVDLGLAYGFVILMIIIFFQIYLLNLGLKTKSFTIIGCTVTIFCILLFSESGSKNSIEYIFFMWGIISIKNE
jgi:hypothetical protein